MLLSALIPVRERVRKVAATLIRNMTQLSCLVRRDELLCAPQRTPHRRAGLVTAAPPFSDTCSRMSGTPADLLHFVDSSPTPFHLVSHAEQILLAAGFAKGGHWNGPDNVLLLIYGVVVRFVSEYSHSMPASEKYRKRLEEAR
jgi:hypothetical protein